MAKRTMPVCLTADQYKKIEEIAKIALKLGKPLIDLNYDPAVDDYKLAEEFLLSGDYYTAIDKFKEIPNLYPKSAIAPKAIYASGWIEENELKDYSAAVTSYDTLIAKYPASEYVRIIAPKVTAYKQEIKKLETAHLDSLNALASADSNRVNNLILEETLIPQQDTIQVALEDEPQTVEQKESVTEQKKLPVTKEPVWNPRRRR